MLWRALQENIGMVMRAYISTKSDFEQWIDEEMKMFEENRLQEETVGKERYTRLY